MYEKKFHFIFDTKLFTVLLCLKATNEFNFDNICKSGKQCDFTKKYARNNTDTNIRFSTNSIKSLNDYLLYSHINENRELNNNKI